MSFATNANFSLNLKHINYFAMKDDIESRRIELRYVPDAKTKHKNKRHICLSDTWHQYLSFDPWMEIYGPLELEI